MDLIARVRDTIARHRLADSETAVLIALSGGSDSVALAYLLRALADRGDLRVSGLVHFNHQLREMADRDEAFCVRLANELGWPLVAGREDVRGRARRERRSLEHVARNARYAFLDRVRRQLSADVVAVGHTRDDQAETFLLRLVRGAGARGLAGIHPRRDTIIRPLLDCTREELKRYLAGRGASYVIDETNDDVSIPRNRVRAELLPLLQSRFNPSIVHVLADSAALARDEWAWMDREAAAVAARVCRLDQDGWIVDAVALSSIPPALSRLVLRRVLTLEGAENLSFEHLEWALAIARGARGSADLPRWRVKRVGSELVLTRRGGQAGSRLAAGPAQPNLFRYPLSIPGEVRLLEANCIVSAEPASRIPAGGAVPGKQALGSGEACRVAAVRLDRCGERLIVRNRRPGDRFRPLGLRGSKKLQDFFVDKKVARTERDAVPLVVDESDRIVWVAGHAVAEDFRVTDPAQAVLILRLRNLGGPH
jgi:tRNA(Ile)-lysidine synthase